MGIFHFLIVIQAIVAAALVGIILMQRSEGGGLGTGSPAGLLSARGAGDFLTRTTAILATAFVVLSIALAFVAARQGGPTQINETIEATPKDKETPPAIPGSAAPTGAATDKAAPADKAPAEKSQDAPLDK